MAHTIWVRAIDLRDGAETNVRGGHAKRGCVLIVLVTSIGLQNATLSRAVRIVRDGITISSIPPQIFPTRRVARRHLKQCYVLLRRRNAGTRPHRYC